MNASTDDLETGVVRDSISNKKCTSCDQNKVDNGNDGASEQKNITMFLHDIDDIDKGYTLDNNSTDSINAAAATNTELHLLEYLPQPLLASVSSYLTNSQRIMLAVALTARKQSWLSCNLYVGTKYTLSPASNVVLSMHKEDWQKKYEKIDLGDMNSELVGDKLLDDIDLKAILFSIDARNNVKSLKLTGCNNIVGNGLGLIAGSNVIEQIDLGVSNDESICLSEAVVLPILNGLVYPSFTRAAGEGIIVVDSERSRSSLSLKQLRFPKKWRTDKSAEFTQFLNAYTIALEVHTQKHSLTCQHKWIASPARFVDGEFVYTKCENECDMGMHKSGDRYGIQTATCYACLKHFCVSEDCGGEEWEGSFEFCDQCEKYFCNDCNEVLNCTKCSKSSCGDCGLVQFCEVCNESFCSDCREVNDCTKCDFSSCDHCGEVTTCDQCEKFVCFETGDCAAGYCDKCEKWFCKDCKTEIPSCSVCFSSSCLDCECQFIACESCNELVCGECENKCCPE